MQRFCVVGTVWCALSMVSVTSAESFPYQAYVHEDEAAIRSGPGRKYYATDRLPWGSKVEVHRQDPGGWCAIRPPEGSFSWVPAEVLRATATDGVAEVVKTATPTRVGSLLGDDRHVQYVELELGELVEVLGTQQPSAGSREQAWVKIAPPAGEFRWIRAKSIGRQPPERAAEPTIEPAPANPRPVTKPPANPDTEPATLEIEQIPTPGPATDADGSSQEPKDRASPGSTGPFREVEPDLPSEVPAGAGPTTSDAQSDDSVQLAAGEMVDQQRQSDGWTPRTAPRPMGLTSPLPGTAETNSVADTTPKKRKTGPSANRSAPNPLSKIRLQLAMLAAEDPNTWQLGELKARTEAYINSESNRQNREEALKLLGKITQFENLQRRHGQLLSGSIGGPPAVAHMPSATAGLPVGTGPVGRASPGTDKSIYDGTGWLMPVVTHRRDVPRYALTDKDGRILQFVTPQPGVNLHRYERQEVGVIGNRGFLPGLGTPHLTAQRVVVLQRHRR
jgi:hypothetical protein